MENLANETRLAALENKVDLILEQLKNNRAVTVNANKIVDNNFEILNSKIGELKTVINTLHIDTNQNFKEVKLELIKINEATGYTDLTSNLTLIHGSKKQA